MPLKISILGSAVSIILGFSVAYIVGQNSMDFLGIGTTSNLLSPELLFNSAVQAVSYTHLTLPTKA